MKRHLILGLRLAIAAIGVVFIVWSLTWVDHLRLPAGFELPGGATLSEPVRAKLLDSPAALTRGEAVTVELPPTAPSAPQRITIEADSIGVGADQVQYEPGVASTLREARWPLLVIGLVLVGVMPVLQAWRWGMLMRCRGLEPGYVKSLRLVLVGMFFNFSLPGMTGGDLVKAYYAARGAQNRGAAVMSVVLDRVAGLLGLALLAGLAGLVALAWLGHPLLGQLTGLVWLGLLGMMVGGHLYLSPRVRRWFAPVGRLLNGIVPGDLLQRVDQAAAAYRHHMGTVYLAVLISLPVHLALMVATGLAGQALGMEASLLLLVAVLPVVFIVGAVPISYQGLGVMEATAMALLLTPEGGAAATANQVVGMLMLSRLYLLAYSLLGTGVLLRGGIHLFPHQVTEAMAKPQ